MEQIKIMLLRCTIAFLDLSLYLLELKLQQVEWSRNELSNGTLPKRERKYDTGLNQAAAVKTA